MDLEPRELAYPPQKVSVLPCPAKLGSLFTTPRGLIEEPWPPLQIDYLSEYLAKLGCRTVVIEHHYIDRDYIDDVALFYSKSLRGYPNYCRRFHFFSSEFDQPQWRKFVTQGDAERRHQAPHVLQGSYLGYLVERPLPGAPIGRTVLPAFPDKTPSGQRAVFEAVRDYVVHLAGFELRVRGGLAFQQQDQGVSACATTALWSALQRVAHVEGLRVPTAADINQAASRYVLEDGRALPAVGLSVYQICEAARAAGLAPLLIQAVSLEHDRAQISAYIRSGFPVVLAIQPLSGGDGHAVCSVGVKLGDVGVQTDPNRHYRDGASAVQGVYVHDDRLGPYAPADLGPHTMRAGETLTIRTALRILWPGEEDVSRDALLKALIVPVPIKLRLTVTRMRSLAIPVAEAAGKMFDRMVTMNCLYKLGTAYREESVGFGLSDDGLYALRCELALSRYIGVIEITAPEGPLFDLLLDTTETQANPAVLACVRRHGMPSVGLRLLPKLAGLLGARCVL